jgi:hypothetical protein
VFGAGRDPGWGEAEKDSNSFLKKRTKKLLSIAGGSELALLNCRLE